MNINKHFRSILFVSGLVIAGCAGFLSNVFLFIVALIIGSLAASHRFKERLGGK